jgi:hypothetical protein
VTVGQIATSATSCTLLITSADRRSRAAARRAASVRRCWPAGRGSAAPAPRWQSPEMLKHSLAAALLAVFALAPARRSRRRKP